VPDNHATVLSSTLECSLGICPATHRPTLHGMSPAPPRACASSTFHSSSAAIAPSQRAQRANLFGSFHSAQMSRVRRSTAPCCCPRGGFRLGLHESSDSVTVLMLARPVYCNFDLSLGAPGWACVCSQIPVPGEVRPQDQRVSDVKNLFFGISFRLLTPVARFPVSSSPCSISCAQELTLLVTSWGPRSSHPTRRLVTARWALIMFVGSSLGCPCVSLRALSCATRATRACVLPPADPCPCPEFAAPSHRSVTPTRVNREDFVLSRIPSQCLPSVCCLVATRACVLPLPNPRPVPPRPVPPHAHLSRA
jgi:hypothetical protein